MNTERQEEILDRLPKWMRELIKMDEEAKKEKLESEKKQQKQIK